MFGAGGGSHSYSCTSGRHFVLRGSESDARLHAASFLSLSPLLPLSSLPGTDSPWPKRSPPCPAPTAYTEQEKAEAVTAALVDGKEPAAAEQTPPPPRFSPPLRSLLSSPPLSGLVGRCVRCLSNPVRPGLCGCWCELGSVGGRRQGGEGRRRRRRGGGGGGEGGRRLEGFASAALPTPPSRLYMFAALRRRRKRSQPPSRPGLLLLYYLPSSSCSAAAQRRQRIL